MSIEKEIIHRTFGSLYSTKLYSQFFFKAIDNVRASVDFRLKRFNTFVINIAACIARNTIENV